MQLPVLLQKPTLAFDCHNHIQLGLIVENTQHSSLQLDVKDDGNDTSVPQLQLHHGYQQPHQYQHKEQKEEHFREITINRIRKLVPNCCGMALMSTHPRDFDIIQLLSSSKVNSPSIQAHRHQQHLEHQRDQQQPSYESYPFHIVPSFGIHPWFIHELSDSDWQCVTTSTIETTDTTDTTPTNSQSSLSTTPTAEVLVTSTGTGTYDQYRSPLWLHKLECHIRDNPYSIIGEIGLDKFHYCVVPTPVSTVSNDTIASDDEIIPKREEKQLTTSIDQQVHVFQLQMQLAIQYQRPVCIHCVHAFGPLLDTLTKLSKQKSTKSGTCGLPPKIYFHAFGGKLGTISQILAICEGIGKGRKSNNSNNQTNKQQSTPNTIGTKCYFGFAPIVNFRSDKTRDIIRTIGISRLLLETDLENVMDLSSSLQDSVQYIAKVLNTNEATVIEHTTKNAMELYNLNG